VTAGISPRTRHARLVRGNSRRLARHFCAYLSHVLPSAGTGETLPELKLHYLTLGTPHRNAAGHVDNAVLLLHGTGGNAHSLLNPRLLQRPLRPRPAARHQKYFLILPDDIGHGESSKPSDGLHAHFPAYDYDDMVRSQRMMLDEMKIDHLRLILGTSMGCMQSFVWGETYPASWTRWRPFACLPVPIAGRNRMMRYMAIQAIKQDPAWMGGDYKTEPLRASAPPTKCSSSWAQAPCRCRSNYAHPRGAEQYVDSYLAHA
jgi:homoserine O-acetyltransferase